MKMNFIQIQNETLIPSALVYREPNRGFTLIKTRENEKLHVSIAHPKRYPSWDELKWIRYNMMSQCKYVAQIFPPENEFINIHENCFHLWELDEKFY